MSIEAYVEAEKRYQRIAFELCKGCDPMFNIAPILDLVRLADAHGFELVNKPRNERAKLDGYT